MAISSDSQRSNVLFRVLLLVLLLVGSQHVTTAKEANTTAEEPKLRAAIVLGILRFTSWPADVQMKPGFTLCTVGNPMSEKYLLRVSGQHQYQDLSIDSHVVTEQLEDIADCNVLVIGKAADRKLLNQFFEQYDTHGLLTICDNCQKNDHTMVKLIRNENRVGFEIDLAESKESGLSFSSLLLELAIEVKQE